MKFNFKTVLLILAFCIPFNAKSQTNNLEIQKQKRIRINAQGGLSYMFAQINPGLEGLEHDHVKDLKSGNNLKFSAHYLFQNRFGVGFMFSNFTSNPVTTFFNTDVDGDGRLEDGEYNESLDLGFYGISLMVQLKNFNNKLIISGDIASGILTYNNDFSYTNFTFPSVQPKTLKGATLGSYIALDFELKLSNNIYFNVCPSALLGVYSNLKINGVENELEEKENVSRVNINAGILIYI